MKGTKLYFFTRPPDGVSGEEQRFTTLYAARSFVKANKGWILSTRREPVV